jgi:hypothetical protein
MNVRWISACLNFATLSSATAAEFIPVAERAKIQSPAIKEASGLAISPTNPGFMWVINDSGGTPDLHLVGSDGADRGKVTLMGVENVDWEDLASFTLDGKPYLLVADTGDNNAKREFRAFHIIREPALPAAGKNLIGTTTSAWQVRFRYEGGPRDCESVAVDAKAGKILFISKRTDPPEVYELPLRAPAKKSVLTARPVGRTSVKSPGGDLFAFSNQPTGLDISADGSLAAVVTYYGVFLFHRAPAESWAEAFSKKPVALPPHRLGQAESVAFSKDGKTIFAISEGRASPIARYQFR